MVSMADGTLKSTKKEFHKLTCAEVQDVRSGDVVLGVNGASKVVCVVKTVCVGGKTQLVQLPGGLRVTPWHPVRINGEWHFPGDVGDILFGEPCPAVFSFVLDGGHIMVINGTECVTLGHGFVGKVVGHAYFGTRAVIDDLVQMAGWQQGIIVLRGGCLLRGEDGLVSGLAKETEIVSARTETPTYSASLEYTSEQRVFA